MKCRDFWFNTNLVVGKCRESFWRENIFIPGFVQNFFPSEWQNIWVKLMNRMGQREKIRGITVSRRALHHGSEPVSNCRTVKNPLLGWVIGELYYFWQFHLINDESLCWWPKVDTKHKWVLWVSTSAPMKTSAECTCFIQAETPRFRGMDSCGWQLSQSLSCSVSSCHNIDFCKLEEVIPGDTVQPSSGKFVFPLPIFLHNL